jgi:hypothetical protein
MNNRMILLIGLLVLTLLVPTRAQDAAAGDNSPLVKSSSSHHVKVTILYIGPLKETYLGYNYAIIYMAEDTGSDEQYQRNSAADPAQAGRVSNYDLFPAGMEVKDGSRKVVGPFGGNWMKFEEAQRPDFKARYPDVTLPNVEHPARARVFQNFYKTALTGPFEITLHTYIPAYGQNTFTFRSLDEVSFSPQ